MSPLFKDILGFIAIALTIGAFIPYIRSIRAGITRPHVFTWLIWGIATLVVFIAQLVSDGGAGAWPTGVSGAITCYIAYLAYRHRGDDRTTRLDWLFFAAAMTAIPCWYFTSDPLAAVLILTLVDLLGYGPTLRKVYHRPQEEQALLYVLTTIRNLLAMVATADYSLATLLFPAAGSVGNVIVIALIAVRRRQLRLS